MEVKDALYEVKGKDLEKYLEKESKKL